MKQPKEIATEFKAKFGDLAVDVVDEIIIERLDYRKQANRYNNDRIRSWQAVKKELIK